MAEFLIRLRGTESGIVDLAGNTWTNNNVTNTGTGRFGGKALTFNGVDSLLSSADVGYVNENEDFTLSFWLKHTPTSFYAHGIIGNISPSESWDTIGQIHLFYMDYSSIVSSTYRGGSIYTPVYGNSGCLDYSSSGIPMYDGQWHHYAISRANNSIKVFFDGNVMAESDISDYQYINSIFLYPNQNLFIGKHCRYNDRYFNGYLDDVCIIKGGALWTEDFTPPTGYLKLSSYAYLSNNSLYTGTLLTNLTNNWSGLTNAEKEALVESFSDEIPSIQDLATISPFRVLTDDTSPINVKVTGQPKVQTIEPTSLINTGAVSTVQSINITNTITDVTVKFAITTDLTTYKIYDAIEGDWVTSTNIEEDGMSIAQINALTPEILALLDISNGIAFKQCFIATSENASAELSEISAVVDIDGSWSQSVHGIDYSVSYPNKTTMSVRLLTNGDYTINYPISSNS